MKVITIKQPWATLIATGYKKYEFRSWKTKYRGPLLIHVGKGIDKEAMKLFEHFKLDYPQSRIIAQVNLEDCILVDEQFNDDLSKENKLVYGTSSKIGNYAWKLSNRKQLSNHNFLKGKLGLWEIADISNLE